MNFQGLFSHSMGASGRYRTSGDIIPKEWPVLGVPQAQALHKANQLHNAHLNWLLSKSNARSGTEGVRARYAAWRDWSLAILKAERDAQETKWPMPTDPADIAMPALGLYRLRAEVINETNAMDTSSFSTTTEDLTVDEGELLEDSRTESVHSMHSAEPLQTPDYPQRRVRFNLCVVQAVILLPEDGKSNGKATDNNDEYDDATSDEGLVKLPIFTSFEHLHPLRLNVVDDDEGTDGLVFSPPQGMTDLCEDDLVNESRSPKRSAWKEMMQRIIDEPVLGELGTKHSTHEVLTDDDQQKNREVSNSLEPQNQSLDEEWAALLQQYNDPTHTNMLAPEGGENEPPIIQKRLNPMKKESSFFVDDDDEEEEDDEWERL